MDVRMVVTGQDASGKSVFVSDEKVVAPLTLQLMPGAEFHRLWGSDEVTKLPTDGKPPPQPSYFPPAGGYRFAFFTLPPQAQASVEGIDFEVAMREFEEKLPGLAGHMEPDNPGMHTTDTVDWDLVISGEIVLELDDGAEVTLRPGDCVIQNGTRHRWHNRGTEPAVLAVAIVGAVRRGATRG